MKFLSIVPLLILVANGLSLVRAETPIRPFVAPVFSDHMVLQRDQADPVWGWARPGETVTVAIAGHTAKAVAGADGKWLAKLTPPPVGGPYELTVTGSQTVTLKDVLVGDVWICSGQSNMEFGMQKVLNSEQEIARADDPQLRLFTVKKTTALHPAEVLQVKDAWAPCTPASIQSQGYWGGFSGVGYFFGRDLRQNLKVPVGLIQVAWGSTYGEVWTSKEGLASISPDFDKQLEGLAQVDKAVEEGPKAYDKLIDDWYLKNGANPQVSTVNFDASSWKTMHKLPHDWGTGDDPALAKFKGAMLFRKEIDLPAQADGKPAELHLGRFEQEDVTWVNETKVGGGTGPWTRNYRVPAGLLKPGKNVIATWVLSEGNHRGIAGKPEDLSLVVQGSAPVSLTGDWKYKVLASADEISARLATVKNNAGWPSQVFNAMVAPLAPFGMRGALWYQGEANVGRAWQYRKLLPALITSWRDRWGQGNFPFLVVQLPNFGPGPGGKPGECSQAELREAQALAAKTLPFVDVVTTIDIGESNNLHPLNKQEVGRRLALVARAGVYHEPVAFSGPVYKSLTRDGASLSITFDHAEGLHAKGDPKLKNFAIAGEDRVFHWADARIAGDKVVLTSPDVPKPVAARYDWGWSPDGNLYNAADLPAFPFRTDDWPLTTERRK